MEEIKEETKEEINEKESGKESKNEKRTYSKNSLLKSAEFKEKKDLLTTLLDDGKTYRKNEVYSAIKSYMKKRGI